jgi:hypothetical protein
MAAQVQVNMISTRSNTNADFWWNTTDPTVVSIRNDLAALFQENNVPTALAVSGDGLTCTMSYSMSEDGQWATIVAQSGQRIPNIAQNRKGYHVTNNHTFKLEVRDAQGDLIQEVQIIPVA